MLGAVDHEVYQKLLEHLIHARVHGVIEMVSSLVEQGKDLSQFVNEFIWYLRNAMVLMTAAEAEELVYPHFFRIAESNQICRIQASDAGGGTDQTVQTSDGRGL